jgi:hypothetical protein
VYFDLSWAFMCVWNYVICYKFLVSLNLNIVALPSYCYIAIACQGLAYTLCYPPLSTYHLARKFPAQNKRNRIEESFLFYFERMFLPMNKIEFVLDWNTCEETPLILGLWTSSGFLWLYVSFIDVTRRFPLPSYFDCKYLPKS